MQFTAAIFCTYPMILYVQTGCTSDTKNILSCPISYHPLSHNNNRHIRGIHSKHNDSVQPADLIFYPA